MSDEFTPNLADQTQCLPRELYGDQVPKVSQRDDSDERATQVELYAERLMNGLDMWTGEPLADASEEVTRMLDVRSRPKCDGSRPKTHNGMVKAA